MKREATSERIAAAARKLLEAEGADAVSMRRVAEAVGITAMAVYRHYEDRDGLLNALADEGFAELANGLRRLPPESPLGERMTLLLDWNIDFALEHPRLFELMFLMRRKGARQFPGDFAAGKSPTGNVFGELVKEGVRDGVLAAGDVWEVVFEVGALLQGMVMLYLGGRVEASEQEFRKMCHRAIGRYMRGIRASQ